MRKGGLTVINLSPGMSTVFTDLAEVIEAFDRGLGRGAHKQVIHDLLGKTAVMVTHEVAMDQSVAKGTSVAAEND